MEYAFFDKTTNVTDTVFNISAASRVKQVHGNKVIKITEPLQNWDEADALVTRTPNLPIGVITADCAPVLFYGDSVIGAAHAGWQGALNGVLENTIAVMDCDTTAIHAFIGPCIAQKSYEVSVGFEKPFLDRDREAERFFIEGARNKLYFDFPGYCAYRLRKTGITNIDIDGRDTLTDPDFHSHRGGATSKERNLSVIMLGD